MVRVKADEKFPVEIRPVDRFGNVAQVDGVPQWSSSNEDVLFLEVAADGLSATAVTTGTVGHAQVHVEVDADLGEGVRAITGLLEVDVMPTEAVTVEIHAGAPIPREV